MISVMVLLMPNEVFSLVVADLEPHLGDILAYGITKKAAQKSGATEDTVTAGQMMQGLDVHVFPALQSFMAMDKAMRGGRLVASFPVELDNQIMLATSRGQSIRVPVDGISFRSRAAGGVRVFNTGPGEEVVSVARIADQGEDEAG